MPYARINMAEFESHEERQRTIGILRRDIKSVFPEIRAFVGVDLGEPFYVIIVKGLHQMVLDV